MEVIRKLVENDPVMMAPDVYKVSVENDRVRVLEIHLKPGERVPQHSHPASVIYAVGDCKVDFIYPDGTSEVFDMKAGQTLWSEAYTHAPENIGQTECHVLNIEIKK